MWCTALRDEKETPEPGMKTENSIFLHVKTSRFALPLEFMLAHSLRLTVDAFETAFPGLSGHCAGACSTSILCAALSSLISIYFMMALLAMVALLLMAVAAGWWAALSRLAVLALNCWLRVSQMGVIHCDLKPGNLLLVCHHGYQGLNSVSVKLADFGLSKILPPGQTSMANGNIGGTVAWAAPECLVSSTSPPVPIIFSLSFLFFCKVAVVPNLLFPNARWQSV